MYVAIGAGQRGLKECKDTVKVIISIDTLFVGITKIKQLE